MNIIRTNNRFQVILFVILLNTAILSAQDGTLPFDVNEVIEQVTYNDSLVRSRNGEFLLDTSVAYIAPSYHQFIPSVAFDGTNYLVVWGDNRNSCSYCIFGARVTPSGSVIDSAGIIISITASNPWNPVVAFDGTNYFVVWQELRNNDWDIYGTRITPSGIVLDSLGVAISTASNSQENPSIIFGGSNYLVSWQDRRSGAYNIYGARVDPSGTILDTVGIGISVGPNFKYYPAVSYDSTNYFVVWHESGNAYDIFGARVSQDGTVLDTVGIAISLASNTQADPSVAFDGVNYFVVWRDERSGDYADIYGARVDPSGIVLDTVGIEICAAEYWQGYPSITFDSTNFVVAWGDMRNSSSSDVYGTRVSPAGIVLDSLGIAISIANYDQWHVYVAFGGTNCLVVWGDERGGLYTDVYGARVSPSGVVLDSTNILISREAYSQWYSSVAFDSINYLVVWEDERSGTKDIYATRVSQTGTILDPLGIIIASASNDQATPSVTFDGTNYFVVWSDERGSSLDIYGARINQSGIVIDTQGIAISTASYSQHSPSVVFGGTNFLVAWGDERSGFPYPHIYGARVNQSGVVLDTSGFVIAMAGQWQDEPSVAFDGTNYFVTWHHYDGVYDIYGARVNQSGVVLEPSGIAISTEIGSQRYPSVTFDGTNYFIVWQDYRNGNNDIYGARMDTSGIVIDSAGLAISIEGHEQLTPAIAFDGAYYLVIWSDGRNALSSDILGAKLDQSGTVIDSFIVSTQLGHQLSPALSHGEGDQFLITYSGWTNEINSQPANTMRIWGKMYPIIGIDEYSELKIFCDKLNLRVYPNPIHKECNIKYSLVKETKVDISLFDVTGRLTKKFIDRNQNLGVYSKKFDVTDLSQGVYFVRLKTEDHSETKKIILIK